MFVVEKKAKTGKYNEISILIFGEIDTRNLDNTNRRINRTLNPASKPTQILVILDVRQCCFFPAFRHCSITPRRDSIPPLS
jgi:hypothetical protein